MNLSKELVDEFEEAVRIDSWKGGGDPAEIDDKTAWYEEAKAALLSHISNLERSSGMFKPIYLFDFDGVIHQYISRWTDAKTISDEPVPGMLEYLEELLIEDKVRVCIYSSRSAQEGGIEAMKAWFEEYGMSDAAILNLEFPVEKPPAFITIDDRCIQFRGDVNLLKEEIASFKVWNQELKKHVAPI